MVSVTATDAGGLSTSTELEVRKLNGTLQPDLLSAHTCVCLLCRFSRLMNHIRWNLNLDPRNKKLKQTATKSSSLSPQIFEDLAKFLKCLNFIWKSDFYILVLSGLLPELLLK